MSSITIESIGEDAASRSLKVTVPVERVRDAESKALSLYAKQARLPGFRPGKAPVAVVRKRFGEGIRQTALEELLRESWEEARTAHSLEPIADPSVRNLKFEEGSPVEFELHVEVKPAIVLKTTGGLSLVRTVPAVTDEMVQEQLDRLREQKATWTPVTGEKPKPGELVRVDVAPFENGAWGSATPYDLVLGQQRAIPELEEQIMTLVPGATTESEVRFPDDHPDASRRGQSRTVRITLHEVKRQELPALDDALAREVGDFDSLAALKTAISTDLAAEAEREADASVRQQLVSQLVQANDVPAPHSLVHRVVHGIAHMYNIPDEQVHAMEGQLEPMAKAQVQRDLLLDAVIGQQGLRATEAELDERIASLAAARKVSPGQLYAQLEQAKRLGDLERSISEEKAFAWLLSQSTVTDAKA